MSLTTKRILKELEQLRKDPPSSFAAQFINNNLYEWHFTIRGPEDSDYSEGIYHGKIELPVDYPIKPPNIFFLTPNGRFEIKTKICLNITKFHPENWNPSWTIRTMIEGIIQHFHVKDFAVGSISYTSNQIKSLALASHKWECDICGPISNLILPQMKIKKIQYSNGQAPTLQTNKVEERKEVHQENPTWIEEKEKENENENEKEKGNQNENEKEKEKEKVKVKVKEKEKEKEKEKFLNQEIDDPSSEEQEIPVNKQKHQEELEKFLWNLLNPEFFGQNNVQIKHFTQQQQQEYQQQQQFQYFDQSIKQNILVYKSMEEEEQVLQTLTVHKTNTDENNNQDNKINIQVHGQNNQSQIMIINILLVTLLVGLVLINFGEYVEEYAKEWLLLK